MQENKKTNKKTIIFQSVAVKNFCDALIQAKSKKTGISIMRLIESALINEFGFDNGKLNEWCCEYCNDSATTSYMSLLRFLPDNNDVFILYKIICHHNKIALSNNIIGDDAIQNGSSNSNVSDDKVMAHKFLSLDRKDLDNLFYDFIYANSHTLDANPVPIEEIITLLLNVDGRCNA